MARKPVSVTLDEQNLTWLQGRARVTAKGNLSEALDRLVTEARTGGRATPPRSVVGTVRLPADDPDLTKAKAAIRALFEESLARPLFVREDAAPSGTTPRPASRRGSKRGRRA
jgi:hypothetical protein